MDLKSKGIAWVGNIYQRIETMCHEVDNIVNQDTVQYVENQVHTMGQSMKKFYSDVQGLIPPIGDPVKPEAQAVVLKANAAVSTCIKSGIHIEEEDYGYTSPIKQSLVESSDFDTVENLPINDFDTVENLPRNELRRYHVVNQSNTPTFGESLEAVESDSSPGEVDDISTNNDHSVHKLVNQSTSPASEESLWGVGSDSARVKIDEVSPSIKLTMHHLVSQSNTSTSRESLEESEFDFAPTKFDDVSANENSGFRMKEIAINDKSNVPEVSESFDSLEKESFKASLSGEFTGSNNESTCVSMSEVSPAASLHVEESQSPQKVEMVCYIPAAADDSDSLSVATSGVVLSEMDFSVASSSGSIFTEPCTLSENSFNAKVGSNGNPGNVDGHDSDNSNVLLSSMSASVVSIHREVAEAVCTCSNSVLSLESTECSNYSSNLSDDITDSEMETIDLFDKMKLEGSCVFVDDSMLYEVSRRTCKLRSYKKKLLDVFTSKKRLSKEYEQLAIWFGDPDMEVSQDTLQSQLQSSSTVILDCDYGTHHIRDSEWELL
ncbi:uncharacterized protein LOC110611812 [Manihot esculenta]|uniref:Uncharacterized protein n=1 Tax=Manihot esculenta TaxID=3983 RepID=A0A251L947_MANES|nr:uncharacterized protein LOC110611812 [Manihot esculenta]XP_043811228.1 uncharacterized protein LOC110611812 [Manihot esculenta]XP_043811229.1 uncharacterized protein LOC110611812 [Manihot esculenta]XP_043811230.1 uncharacterized protein LOC110611812 [Manihot esculenta]XP_043811231.1 uncharacterized protein LOC110611812 [Manihot esculenta]OAY54803.1 hypothetical protein MANES_03G103000v8 [Manihot esculenta]